MKKNIIEGEKRIPIVAILGHVDHGKTSILDKIRKADVQAHEAGGITQKISVFTITPEGSKNKITFIDTPGHEAFDLMRSRGGDVADIVLLIVAADDGVKPQTEESIEIIKKSSAKPIIVINKCDLPDIDIEKIKRTLAQKDLIPDDMGGTVPVAKVSGKTGEGIKELLELIDLVVEVEGLKNRDISIDGVVGKAVVLESYKDKCQGYVSSVVVTSGNVEKGNCVVYQKDNAILTERIKAFVSEDMNSIEKLNEGFGGKIIGLSNLVELGSELVFISEGERKNSEKIFQQVVKKDEKVLAEEVAEEDFFKQYFEANEVQNKKKNLNLVINASTEGSLQAIKKSLEKITSEEININVQSAKVGDITQKDIDLAEVTRSIILGFEVSIESGVIDIAEKKKVLIKRYDIIYQLIDEIKDTVEMLESGGEFEEELGNAVVKAVFTLSNGTKVIGAKVKEGKVKRGERFYIIRNDDIIAKGKIVSMKHEKTEINEAKVNDEFGATVNPTPEDVVEGDTLFCFKVITS